MIHCEERQTQETIVREQDVILDELVDVVIDLKEEAHKISKNLDHQDKLISKLDGEVDRADSGVKRALHRVRSLLFEQKEGKFCFLITVLSIVLTIVVILAVYL